MSSRNAAIFGLVLLCFASSAEDGTTTDEYEAKVVFVKMLSEYKGTAIRIDRDARWVVRLRKNDGSESTYAIHSPTHTLHDVNETIVGKTVRIRETISTLTSGSKLRTIERVVPTTDP